MEWSRPATQGCPPELRRIEEAGGRFPDSAETCLREIASPTKLCRRSAKRHTALLRLGPLWAPPKLTLPPLLATLAQAGRTSRSSLVATPARAFQPIAQARKRAMP